MQASQRTWSGLKVTITISCYFLEHRSFGDDKGWATLVGSLMPPVPFNSVPCCVRQRRADVYPTQDSRLPMPHTLHMPPNASWHSLKDIQAGCTVTSQCPRSKRNSSFRWSWKQIMLHCTEQSRKNISISPQICSERKAIFWTQSKDWC